MEFGPLLYLESHSFFFFLHVVPPLFTADKVRERVGQAEGVEAGGIITAEEPSL